MPLITTGKRACHVGFDCSSPGHQWGLPYAQPPICGLLSCSSRQPNTRRGPSTLDPDDDRAWSRRAIQLAHLVAQSHKHGAPHTHSLWIAPEEGSTVSVEVGRPTCSSDVSTVARIALITVSHLSRRVCSAFSLLIHISLVLVLKSCMRTKVTWVRSLSMDRSTPSAGHISKEAGAEPAHR